MTYHGPVAVWWVPQPRRPRLSLWGAALAWLIAAPLTAGIMLWNWAGSYPVWPFGHVVSSATEILLRYQLILMIFLAYLTAWSLPTWIRYRLLARRDGVAVDSAIREERWEQAGVFVHRYCLLVSAIWRRVPARVATWDAVLRPHLPLHRRLYVYYRASSPPVPPDPLAGFEPVVVRPPDPPLWSMAVLVPIALLLYQLVMDIVRSGYWQRAILFNAVLMAIILVSYSIYFLLSLLGRSRYLRFAPGALQIVRYRPLRRTPIIETFDLRRLHAVLDVASGAPGLTLLDPGGGRKVAFRLPRGGEVVEATLRAVLSTAPRPPLPEDGLVG